MHKAEISENHYNHLKYEVAEQSMDEATTLVLAKLAMNTSPLVDFFKNQLEKTKRISQFVAELVPSLLRRKQFKIWDSTPYLVSGRETFGHEQNKTHFLDNTQTFFDEYASLNPRKKYTNYGKHGIGNRSAMPTTELCRHFAQALETKKMDPTRAYLETYAAKTLEDFLANPNIQASSILIQFSPRGTLQEGYPGLQQKNYVFINVYIKKDDQTAELRQFTSYATTEQLTQQHNSLKKTEIYNHHFLQNTENYDLPKHFNKEHTLISQPILIQAQSEVCTPSETIEQIEHILYQDQKNWPIKIQDLPVIDVEAYTTESSQVLSVIGAEFDTIHSLLSSGSIEPKKAQQLLDSLVILFRKYLLKWVETNAANIQKNNKKQAPLPEISEVITTWRENAYDNGKSSNKKNSKRTQKNRMSLLGSSLEITSQSLLTASSAAHCVLGTPSSLIQSNLANSLLQNSLTQANTLGSMSSVLTKHFSKINAQEFESLSKNPESCAKMRKLQELLQLKQNLKKIEVFNRKTNQFEQHYIWLSDAKFLGDYQATCYKQTTNGEILGPCDIALSEDDLLLSFAYQLTQQKYITEVQYQKIQQEIFELEMQLALEAALASSINAGERQNQGLSKNLNQKDAQRIAQVISALSKRIFRITLSNLIAGIVDYTDEFLSLPKKCISFLNKSGENKLHALHELLVILETEDIENISNRLLLRV